MPDFLKVLDVVPRRTELPSDVQQDLEREIRLPCDVWYLDPGDEDFVWRDINALVREIARVAPSVEFTALVAGGPEWVDLTAWMVRDGVVHQDTVQLSLAADEYVHIDAPAAPEVGVELEVDPDQVLDAIDAASVHPDETRVEGRALYLPLVFSEVGAALSAAALVASHQRLPAIEVVIRVGGSFYRLTMLRRKEARVEPLWPWFTDPTARALAQRTFPEPAVGGRMRCPQGEPPAEGPDTLSNGSIRSRIAAIEALSPTAEGAYSRLATAIRSPANAGAKYAPVRRSLAVAMVAANERRAVDDLFMLLPGEADSVREEIYELFTRVESEVADRALLHGFKEERERVLTLVSEVIWRKQSAVTLLVREDLVRAWGADRKYAKRILRLLSEECLRVPRSATLGAPADLVEALGSHLIDDP